MKDLKSLKSLKNLKSNNTGMKILSVFIAILIWLLVANINDPVRTERFSGIPVQIINENALTSLGYAYEVLEGDEVSITVEGKRSVLNDMSASDFQAVADFSKLSEVDAVPIDVSAKKYANQLEITLGNVNTMKIKKDAVVSVSVPVNIILEGSPAEGYAVGNTTGTPNLVKVTGPENLLESAKEIQAVVDIDGISHDVTTTADPILYNDKNEVIDSKQVQMDTTSINVMISLWKTKMVNVNLQSMGTPAAGYEMTSFDYEPKQVLVAAPEDVLEEMTAITLPNISVEGMTQNYEEDIKLDEDYLPDDAIFVEDNEDVKVQATIEKRITRRLSFTEADISIRGRGAQTITFSSDNRYSIRVEGAESYVKELKITDFTPWVDVTDLESGEHTLRLHVKEVDGVTVDSIPDITLTIG